MNARTKIFVAFLVGTTAGTLLGMLLSGEKSKVERLTAGDGKTSASFLRRVFAGKHRVSVGDLKQAEQQDDSGYEQA